MRWRWQIRSTLKEWTKAIHKYAEREKQQQYRLAFCVSHCHDVFGARKHCTSHFPVTRTSCEHLHFRSTCDPFLLPLLANMWPLLSPSLLLNMWPLLTPSSCQHVTPSYKSPLPPFLSTCDPSLLPPFLSTCDPFLQKKSTASLLVNMWPLPLKESPLPFLLSTCDPFFLPHFFSAWPHLTKTSPLPLLLSTCDPILQKEVHSLFSCQHVTLSYQNKVCSLFSC